MDAKELTTIGLSMDIVGIVLLFLCGGVGGEWIDRNVMLLSVGADDAARAKDRQLARWGAGLGLLLAVSGFGLQIVAQWV